MTAICRRMEVLKIRGVKIFLGEACGRRAGGLGVGCWRTAGDAGEDFDVSLVSMERRL